jgi:DNA-binding HxlR family transcriptional regulator
MNSNQKSKAKSLPNPWSEGCPSRQVVELIGNKWALLVMPLLKGGKKRNGDLMRRIEGISQKMLTQTLRELENNGLVHRVVFDSVPPHVEYSLTQLGESLGRTLKHLDVWVVSNTAAIVAARKKSLAQANPKVLIAQTVKLLRTAQQPKHL